MMTESRLAEIEACANKATVGKWVAGRMDMESYTLTEGPFKQVYCGEDIVARGEGDDCRPNAAFVALARSAVPELIAEVRRLQAEAKNLYRIIARERDEKNLIGRVIIAKERA